MDIAVITVPRTPPYLAKTLRSIHNSAELDANHSMFISIGVPRHDFTILGRGVSDFSPVLWMPTTAWDQVKALPSHLKAVANFVQALEWGSGPILLVEDDVAFKPGWLPNLEMIAAEVPRAMISLYSHRAYQDDANAGFVSLRYPIMDFNGTLGLYVPAQYRRALAAAARSHLDPDDPRKWPFDEIVKMFVNDRYPELELLVTVPSWVDHIGEVSVINPTHGPRKAPMF